MITMTMTTIMTCFRYKMKAVNFRILIFLFLVLHNKDFFVNGDEGREGEWGRGEGYDRRHKNEDGSAGDSVYEMQGSNFNLIPNYNANDNSHVFDKRVYLSLKRFRSELNEFENTSSLDEQVDLTVNNYNNNNNNNNNNSNLTNPDEELDRNYYSVPNIIRMIVLSVIYSAIIITTLIGNMLVILAVIIVRKLHSQDNANNYLIVSLATSDLLVGVLAMPLAFYVDMSKGNRWHLGGILCDLWTLSDMLLCTASILNLCAISVDRYFIILHAMKYTQRRNAKLMFLMILVVWLLAAVISIPPLFGWGKPSARLPTEMLCSVSDDLKYQIYATMLAFYLPLLVMIIIYINIFRAAAKIKKREAETSARPQFNNLASESGNHFRAQHEPLLAPKNSMCSANTSFQFGNGGGNLTVPYSSSSSDVMNHTTLAGSARQSKFGRRLTQVFSGMASKRHSQITASGKNQKATRTLGIIMGSFIICWVPFFLLALIKPIPTGGGHKVGTYIPQWFDSLLLWLGYFNSALNPMIYASFNREFRRPFIEILCFRCRGINAKLREKERAKMYSATHASSYRNSTAQLQPPSYFPPTFTQLNSSSFNTLAANRDGANDASSITATTLPSNSVPVIAAAAATKDDTVLPAKSVTISLELPIVVDKPSIDLKAQIELERKQFFEEKTQKHERRKSYSLQRQSVVEIENDSDVVFDLPPTLSLREKTPPPSTETTINKSLPTTTHSQLIASNQPTLISSQQPLATSTPPLTVHRQKTVLSKSETVSSSLLDETIEEDMLHQLLASIDGNIEPGRKNSIESSTLFANALTPRSEPLHPKGIAFRPSAIGSLTNTPNLNKLLYLKRMSDLRTRPDNNNNNNNNNDNNNNNNNDNNNNNEGNNIENKSLNGTQSLNDSMDQSTCSIFDQVEKSMAHKLTALLMNDKRFSNIYTYNPRPLSPLVTNADVSTASRQQRKLFSFTSVDQNSAKITTPLSGGVVEQNGMTKSASLFGGGGADVYGMETVLVINGSVGDSVNDSAAKCETPV